MKFNTFNWNLYKESEAGKKLIADFATIVDCEKFAEFINGLFPEAGIDVESFTAVLDATYAYKVSEYESKVESGAELSVRDLWTELISTGYMAEDEIIIKPGDFREMIGLIPFLSINLYLSFPDSFIPYLFFSRFAELKSILDFYDIDIPALPSKKDYEGRCNYYLLLNDALLNFRDEIGLSPAEFCAFIYGFAPAQIENEEIRSPYNRMWISGGHCADKNSEKICHWGNNEMARKGDWMLLYELSPVSAVTSIWQLVSDGCNDPFFQWNAKAAVKYLIDFPQITLQELREDPYFSNHPLVRRNMQGVNGTAFSAEDYNNLLRMIAGKGFDIAALPKMEGMNDPSADSDFRLEKDVEEKLLIPLLNKLDLEEDRDYIRQLPIQAGRGHRIFPDFAVYYSDKPDEESAHILIEAKLKIKNGKELEAAFLQAQSYAKLLGSSVIIICDKDFLYIYKASDSAWNKSNYHQILWSELTDASKYSEIAFVFDRKQYSHN